MPKLHDMCQILVEEVLNACKHAGVPDSSTSWALSLCLELLESKLVSTHPQGSVLADHLWIELSRRAELGELSGLKPMETTDPRLLQAQNMAWDSAERIFTNKQN